MTNRLVLLPFFCVVVPLVLYILFIQAAYWSTVTIPSIAIGTISNITKVDEVIVHTGPIVFVGDVLLARNVEFLMNTKGVEYPFKNLSNIFGVKNYAVIGNFESAILEQHIKTPSFTTTFSVDKTFLPTLQKSGFTHMSVANNHAFDYGSTTFKHTLISLEQAGITPFGHPTHIDGLSAVTIPIGDKKVGLLAINEIFNRSSWDELQNNLDSLSSSTDMQIIYIHWGEEYILKHDGKQEALAKQLIDAGADAIIGHHPHVVQDIDIYKNRPIFYSLGNFIFDQYFSVDVKQGLVVKFSFVNDEVHYDLVPVTSEGAYSQPALMDKEARTLFLTNLARRSNPIIANNIKQGKVILTFSLASYPQNGMITP